MFRTLVYQSDKRDRVGFHAGYEHQNDRLVYGTLLGRGVGSVPIGTILSSFWISTTQASLGQSAALSLTLSSVTIMMSLLKRGSAVCANPGYGGCGFHELITFGSDLSEISIIKVPPSR